MDRVPYGKENRFVGKPPLPDERCPVCYAKPGEFHYQGCSEEVTQPSPEEMEKDMKIYQLPPQSDPLKTTVLLMIETVKGRGLVVEVEEWVAIATQLAVAVRHRKWRHNHAQDVPVSVQDKASGKTQNFVVHISDKGIALEIDPQEK